MKYVVLRNSLNVLCVQLPEGFGTRLEIVCFESQAEFNDFLKENPAGVSQISFPQTVPKAEEPEGNPVFGHDGLFVRQDEYFGRIRFADILWLEASRSYSYIHVAGNSRIIVTYPMSEVKKKLPPDVFIQIHRSYVVNVHYVDKFIGNVLYIGEQSFPISRKFKPEVLNRFLFLDNIKKTWEKYEEPLGKNNEEFGNYSLNQQDEDFILGQ